MTFENHVKTQPKIYFTILHKKYEYQYNAFKIRKINSDINMHPNTPN